MFQLVISGVGWREIGYLYGQYKRAFANLMLVSWLVNLLVSVVAWSVQKQLLRFGLLHWRNAQGQRRQLLLVLSWSQVLQRCSIRSFKSNWTWCNCYSVSDFQTVTWRRNGIDWPSYRRQRKTSCTFDWIRCWKTNCYFHEGSVLDLCW